MPAGDQLNPYTFLTDDEVSSNGGDEIPPLNFDDILPSRRPKAPAPLPNSAERRKSSSASGPSSGKKIRGNVARKSSYQPPRPVSSVGESTGAVSSPRPQQPVSSATRAKKQPGASQHNPIPLISSDEDEEATPIARRPPAKARSARKSASGSPTKATSRLPSGPSNASFSQIPAKWPSATQSNAGRFAMQEMDLQPIVIPDTTTSGPSSAVSQKDKDRRRSTTAVAPPARVSPPAAVEYELGIYGEAGPGPSTMAHASRIFEEAVAAPSVASIAPPRKSIASPPPLPSSTSAMQPMDLQPIQVTMAKRAKSPPNDADLRGDIAQPLKKPKNEHPSAQAIDTANAAVPPPATNVASSPVKRGPTWATAQSQRTPEPQPKHQSPPPPQINPPEPAASLNDAMDVLDELGNSSAAEMDVDAKPEARQNDIAEPLGGGATPAKDLLRMLGLYTEETTSQDLPPVAGDDLKTIAGAEGAQVDTPSVAEDPLLEPPERPSSSQPRTATPQLLDLPNFSAPPSTSSEPTEPQQGGPEQRKSPISITKTVDENPSSTFQAAPLELPALVASEATQTPTAISNKEQAKELDADDEDLAMPIEMQWNDLSVETAVPSTSEHMDVAREVPPDAVTAENVEAVLEDVRVEVDDIDLGRHESRASSIVPMTKEDIEREMRERMSDPAFQDFLRAKGITADEWLAVKPTKTRARENSIEDVTDERLAETKAARRAKAKAAKLERSQALQKRIKPKMTREEWRRMIELADDLEVDRLISPDSPLSNDLSSLSADGVDHHLTASNVLSPNIASSSIRGATPSTFDPIEQPPPGRRGRVLRDFHSDEVAQIDNWNRQLPRLSASGPVLRMIFESWISEATATDEPFADPIRVVNMVDTEDLPPDMEYRYSNKMIYHRDVPDPELGTGCSCDGPCSPTSRTCSCVKRQELYFYNTGLKGFAYDEDGHLQGDGGIPIWECGPLCGCPPECWNRVIQRGRTSLTKIDLFKTRQKGWGIRARCPIPRGTFLGIYSGEMISELESERRGYVYDEIGRTYLFDLDGWQIRNPPPLNELRKLDPRLAELAERAYLKSIRAMEENDDDGSSYSAYSVDAFHWGNFTRYFNHSCNPNLSIVQAYVTDCNPERPMLVIFTRRDVSTNEELCISYKGPPDDEEVEAAKAKRMPKAPIKTRRARRKNKSSATAHVNNRAKASLVKDPCKCGAPNCDGRMWVTSAADEASDEEDDADV